MNQEPVAITDALKSLLLAVVAGLVAFGVWEPTETQTAAILGLFAAVNLVVSAFVRGRVTPYTPPQEG